MKLITRNRARIEILNYIINFATTTYYDEHRNISQKDWSFESVKSEALRDGDLVRISAAPFTKWYLSWFKEIRLHDNGWHEFLLESIEDGGLCWWSNVSLVRFSPIKVKDMEHWKWDDNQWDFADKVKKVLSKYYSINYYPPEFKEDGSVEVKGRYRWTQEHTESIKYPDYKKVLLKDLVAFFKTQKN